METIPTADPCTGRRSLVVCRCLQVTEEELLGAFAVHAMGSVKEVRRCTGAGDGCTACHRVLQRYVDERSHASSASPICSVR